MSEEYPDGREPPSRFTVFLTGRGCNDPYVAGILNKVFRIPFDDAARLQMDAIQDGKSVIFSSTLEVADEKAAAARRLLDEFSRAHGRELEAKFIVEKIIPIPT